MLNFSKSEAGKLTVEVVDFDLRKVVEVTLELLAERAHAKGLDLGSLIPTEVFTCLRDDLGRLRKVLVNLLGNAIKFTTTESVVVNVLEPWKPAVQEYPLMPPFHRVQRTAGSLSLAGLAANIVHGAAPKA